MSWNDANQTEKSLDDDSFRGCPDDSLQNPSNSLLRTSKFQYPQLPSGTQFLCLGWVSLQNPPAQASMKPKRSNGFQHETTLPRIWASSLQNDPMSSHASMPSRKIASAAEKSTATPVSARKKLKTAPRDRVPTETAEGFQTESARSCAWTDAPASPTLPSRPPCPEPSQNFPSAGRWTAGF